MGLRRTVPGGRRRLLLRLGLAALAALALLLAVDGLALWRALAVNRAIAQGRAAAMASATDAPTALRFAATAEQAASGAGQDALDGWRALQSEPGALGRAARYNGANALLRQALALREAGQPGQALTLLELAKEGYREVLRHDPGHWDARYNLERALRLQPDPEEAEVVPAEAPRDAERAATTARGVAQGLP